MCSVVVYTSSSVGVSFTQKITHGSFLSRKPETLAKVAEMVKSVANPNGSRSSRNFVFTTVSPDEKQKPPTPRPPLVLSDLTLLDYLSGLMLLVQCYMAVK